MPRFNPNLVYIVLRHSSFPYCARTACRWFVSNISQSNLSIRNQQAYTAFLKVINSNETIKY